MREFERTRRDSAGTDHTGQRFPEDFSLEEATFASELRELFPIEAEILPPQFIQTVIEDERYSSPPPGFEQKLAYNVFSRLSLPRGPLFPQQPRTPWNSIRHAFNRTTRPLAASLVAVALMMVFSVVVASPSFAAGLQLLLTHTGVRQVSHYPSDINQAIPKVAYRPVNLTPTIPVSWLGPTADKYAFTGARALPAQRWSSGPIIELQYTIPHETPGSGILDIREFQIAPDLSAVLQMVQTGSAKWVNVEGTPAVYVNGIWSDRAIRQQPMMDAPTWLFGVRSELMIERDGIVFWIVGDQRDGTGEAELIKLASMLTVTNNRILHPYPVTLHGLGESFMQVFQKSQGREVYYLMPRGAALSSDTGFILPSDNLYY
ncbi:MAG TPA: hypothetical protein VJR48_05715 [Ktedonobacterales bacterium]|nr:hypothetical protein [Ktedonobacterales bacterium]